MATISYNGSPAESLGYNTYNLSYNSSPVEFLSYSFSSNSIPTSNSYQNQFNSTLGGYLGQTAQNSGLGYNSVTGDVFKTIDYSNNTGNTFTNNTGNISVNTSSGLDKALQFLSNQKSNTTSGSIQSGIGKLGSGIKSVFDSKKAGTSVQGGWGQILGAVGDFGSTFMPEKTEYSGTKGSTTQTLDSVYDGISDALMMIPGWGQLVGGIMKLGGFVGDGVNALGGGTDGMTNIDAILGSSFLNLTPLGLINGFGGSKTDTITKDNEAFTRVGSSYTGSYDTIDDAVSKSGKKYGLFSQGAKNKANELIADARTQQDIIRSISDDVSIQNALSASMSAINANRYKYNLFGGYDQRSVRVGKKGMSLELLTQNINKLKKFQRGGMVTSGMIEQDSNSSLEEIISNQLLKQHPNFIERLRNKDYRAIQTPDGEFGNVYVGDIDNIVFPNIQEIDGKLRLFKNPKDAYENALKTGDYLQFDTDEQARWFGKNYKTLPEFKSYFEEWDTNKQPQLDYWPLYKQGGTIIELIDPSNIENFKDGGVLDKESNITLIDPSNIEENSIIELIDPNAIEESNEEITEFKDGGSVNVIPDGALHARLHHMENADNLTKKGIPVVDNDGEQQAEVEVGEIILNLDLTQKLEKLGKKYYDETSTQKEKDSYALEAGELLVNQILNNTQDNTNKLL